MSTLFADLTQDPNVKSDGDRLGSEPVTSGLYRGCTVEMMYATTAKSGAKALTVSFKTESGRTIKRTEYITSGTAKGGKTTYVNKTTGETHFLPGFTLMNDLCLLTTNKPLSSCVFETKHVPVYDFELKTDVVQELPVATEVIGKKVDVGVIVQIVDKQAMNDAGVYVNTGETRKDTTVNKLFLVDDGRTVTECKAGATEAAFQVKWEEKNTGIEVDRTSKSNAKKSTGKTNVTAAATANAEDNLFATA